MPRSAAAAVKNFTLKIACLVAALFIWILVAGTTMVEVDVGLPLQVEGLADGLTIAGSSLPDEGLVRLRVSKLRYVAHQYFGRTLGRVRVDLAEVQPGQPLLVELADGDVQAEAEVVSLLPPLRLRIQLDQEVTRRLPVRVPLRGALPADRLLCGPISTQPDSLEVTGPRRFFAGLDTLATEPVDLSGLQRTLVRDLALAPLPRPLVPAAGSVQATVPIAVLGLRVMANVPVVPLVESQLGDAGVSPPVCDVLVRGPADSVAALTPARLTVTVPVSGLANGVHQVPGRVQHPDWVVSIELDPATFMVLIGPASGEGERP